MQVTRQLAVLCIQAHQYNTPLAIRYLTTTSLAVWLYKACKAAGSPGSRLAVSMRQQLQTAGLLQQMASVFQHAADALSAAAAPFATFGQAASRSSGGSSSTDIAHAVQLYDNTLVSTSKLLDVYIRACRLCTPEGGVPSFEVALPAAAAAVQLHRLIFTTGSSFLQLASMEGIPEAVVRLARDADFQQNCTGSLGEAHWAIGELLKSAHNHSSTKGSLQSLPGARELLLCPDLVPCLAVTVLVTVLGLDTGAQEEDTGSGSRSKHAAQGASSSSSSSAAGSSSRTASGSSSSSRQASAPQGAPPQQVDSSTRYLRPGSSSTSRRSSSGRQANGISLDSLTPLSRSLFSLLGVEQGVLLQAAVGAKAKWSGSFKPASFENMIHPYRFLLQQQVGYWQTNGCLGRIILWLNSSLFEAQKVPIQCLRGPLLSGQSIIGHRV